MESKTMKFERKETRLCRMAILTAGFFSLLSAVTVSVPAVGQAVTDDGTFDGDVVETPRLFEDLDEQTHEDEGDWDDPADSSDAVFDLENRPGLGLDYEDGTD